MNIRPSPIAGSWYPGQPEALIWELNQYLDRARVKPPRGKVWGIVVPHAGYSYSGPVAAYAFKCLLGVQPEVVAVISPFHHGHHAPLLTTAHEAYKTPSAWLKSMGKPWLNSMAGCGGFLMRA